jgi:hypothetical protein
MPDALGPDVAILEEIVKNLKLQMQPKGTAPLVSLRLKQTSYLNDEAVQNVIAELEVAVRMASGTRELLTNCQRLALHVLLDSAGLEMPGINTVTTPDEPKDWHEALPKTASDWDLYQIDGRDEAAQELYAALLMELENAQALRALGQNSQDKALVPLSISRLEIKHKLTD